MGSQTAGPVNLISDDDSSGASAVKDGMDTAAASLHSVAKGKEPHSSHSDILDVCNKKLGKTGAIAKGKEPPSSPSDNREDCDKKLSPSGTLTPPALASEDIKPQLAPTYLWRLPEHAQSWPPDCQVIQLIETDPQIRKHWNQHVAS